MKTRIWKCELELSDHPEYDDEGVPYPYLKKAQIAIELAKLDLPAFLSLKLVELKMIGHRQDKE